MAYWWVNQRQSFREERAAGYLWAPQSDKGGLTPYHWNNMTLLEAGDVVFSYANGTIRAISIVVQPATESLQPPALARMQRWNDRGWRAEVVYSDLDPPLVFDHELFDQLRSLLPERYSPITINGAAQGYLFRLTVKAGRLLLDLVSDRDINSIYSDPVEQAVSNLPILETEKQALKKSRIGQGRFRSELLRRWNYTCSASGCSIVELLRASHIKPWQDSNNKERLDPNNGLLLSPSYDAAFDMGYISFADDGRILISPSLTTPDLERLGISQTCQIGQLNRFNQEY